MSETPDTPEPIDPESALSADATEPTTAYTGEQPRQPQWAFPTAPPPATRRGRSVRPLGLLASGVVAAIVLGAAAGYGGAALYHHTSDDSSTSLIVDSGSGKNASDTTATDSVESVAKKVLPSVVKIEVAGSQEADSGSGIILSADGKILTNNHVVAAAAKSGQIRVDFSDGTQAAAKILGTDPLTDTAVIQAEDVKGLTPATIGKSSQLLVGQSVVAIGSPFGLDSTVTTGIVSALDRPVNVGQTSDGSATVYPAIQTDAAINPGNSGGPLVTLSGDVIGINASIQSTTSDSSSDAQAGSIGLGFAIPIDEVLPIIQQMIDGKTPTHARLGISVSDVGATTSSDQGGQQTQPGGGSGSDGSGSGGSCLPWPFGNCSDGSNGLGGGSGSDGSGSDGSGGGESTDPSAVFGSLGAQVQSVENGSAGSKLGLQKGDVITKVNDLLISGSDSLIATIRSYRPGDTVTVTWTRDGKTQSGKIALDSDQ